MILTWHVVYSASCAMKHVRFVVEFNQLRTITFLIVNWSLRFIVVVSIIVITYLTNRTLHTIIVTNNFVRSSGAFTPEFMKIENKTLYGVVYINKNNMWKLYTREYNRNIHTIYMRIKKIIVNIYNHTIP